MRKFLALVIALATAGGGWLFTNNFKIEGLDGISLTPRQDLPTDPGASGLPGVQRGGNAIRVASFNIQVFGESKMAKPRVAALFGVSRQTVYNVSRAFDEQGLAETAAAAGSAIGAAAATAWSRSD